MGHGLRSRCRATSQHSRQSGPESGVLTFKTVRTRINSQHSRQKGPGSGPGFQVKVLKTILGVSSSLGSGARLRPGAQEASGFRVVGFRV